MIIIQKFISSHIAAVHKVSGKRARLVLNDITSKKKFGNISFESCSQIFVKTRGIQYSIYFTSGKQKLKAN